MLSNSHVFCRTTEQHRKQHSFDVSYKLKAIKFSEENSSKRRDCKEVQRTCKTSAWCSQKDKLEELATHGKAKRKRLDGGGRKPFDEQLEEELFQWVLTAARLQSSSQP